MNKAVLQRIKKLEAHAAQLLDSFLMLTERYSLLRPMIVDNRLMVYFSNGYKGRGFVTLRTSLMFSCIQDIVNQSFDSSPKAPSIKQLVASLEDPSLVDELRESYAIWVLSTAGVHREPELLEALKSLELREREKRREEFDKIRNLTLINWEKFSDQKYIDGFRKIRDKVTAHTEVILREDQYEPLDIGRLGIKWSDLQHAVESMRELVDSLNMLIRNAGFAWGRLDEQLAKSSEAFWNSAAGES